LQTQAVIAVLVIGEFELVGQFEHAALPLALLYFPDTHVVQGPPSGPVVPVSHGSSHTSALMQLAQAPALVLPAGEFAAHCEQRPLLSYASH
jgi:hypothetical protein